MAKLNLEKYKKQKAELGRSNNATSWRAQPGTENVIRVFMFEHKVTKEDVTLKLYNKDEIGTTQKELSRMGMFHYNLNSNPKIPTHTNPEIQKVYQEVSKRKDPKSKALADKIKPNKKYFLNVVDLNDIDGGMKIFPASKTVYDAILKYLTDEDYGEECFGCNGRNFKIEYDDKAKGSDMYSVLIGNEKNSKPLPSDLEKQVSDLYDPKIFSSFAKDLVGDLADYLDYEDTTVDEEKEDDEDDELDEEETDNEDEEDEVKTSKSKKEEVDEDDDELEDDEDEDDEEPFVSSKKKKK